MQGQPPPPLGSPEDFEKNLDPTLLEQFKELEQQIVVPQEPPTEETICNFLIMHIAQKLALDPDEIDIDEHLSVYELESIDVFPIIMTIDKWIGKRLSPTLLYNYTTIRTLSERLGEEADVSA
jgi:acyl carrier protein